MPITSLGCLCSSLCLTIGSKLLGFDVAGDVGTNLIATYLPEWLRDAFRQHNGDPNHHLAAAMHAAVKSTLEKTCKGSPLGEFKSDPSGAWATLHAGSKQAVDKWFSDLAEAAEDPIKAGAQPLVPDLTNSFLLDAIHDTSSTTLERLRQLVRRELEARLASPDPDHVQHDAAALAALDTFATWLTDHLSDELRLQFINQLKPKDGKPTAAWVAYDVAARSAMQDLLIEIAGHTVGTRETLQALIARLDDFKAPGGMSALSAALSSAEGRIVRAIGDSKQEILTALRTEIVPLLTPALADIGYATPVVVQWPDNVVFPDAAVADRHDECNHFRAMLTGQCDGRVACIIAPMNTGKSRLLELLYDTARNALGEGCVAHLQEFKELTSPAKVIDELYKALGAVDSFPKYFDSLIAHSGKEPVQRSVFLGELCTRTVPALILLDTWDKGNEDMQSWVKNELIPIMARAPSVRLVIAGRDVTKDGRPVVFPVERPGALQHFTLGPVGLTDWQQYVDKRTGGGEQAQKLRAFVASAFEVSEQNSGTIADILKMIAPQHFAA